MTENLDKWPSKMRDDLQNQAIGRLRKGCCSLGGRPLV
jgi:hypothetical protein